jgi:pimeloyl-ACP methyl ester carboxylesterase
MAEGSVSETTSADGTRIAYEKRGNGPAVILVDGAFCSRAFGPSPRIAPLLAHSFTVYTYDRRGRGQSGDAEVYAPSREVEDLASLIKAAGGSASLVGLSSGGALALEAAASGLRVNKVVAYEPPYIDDAGNGGGAAHEGRLRRFLMDDDRSGAVKYFMKDMVSVPAFGVAFMRLMPWLWGKLTKVAHTLPYDAQVMTEFRIPRTRFASIRVPVLMMNGTKTQPRLKDAAKAVAGVVPGAQYRELAGQTHNVDPAILAPAVSQFLEAR